MITGLLFPGQGSQAVGMGKDLYDTDSDSKDVLDRASEFLKFDLREIMFYGDEVTLRDTKNAQIAIYVCSAMYFEKYKKKNIAFSHVAGHSIGEYAALYAAGVYPFEVGLALVKERGALMAKENGKGIMAAVLGMYEEDLKKELENSPDVVIANLNSKNQIVISGTVSGIRKVSDQLDGVNGVKVRMLNVSAAFHSPQMINAQEKLSDCIDRIEFSVPQCQVVSNVTGVASTDPEIIKQNLKKQITGQVRWYDSIMCMKNAGVDAYYEVGYGNVLKKLNKTIVFKPKCYQV